MESKFLRYQHKKERKEVIISIIHVHFCYIRVINGLFRYLVKKFTYVINGSLCP